MNYRRLRPNLVRFLVVAGVREAGETPLHLGSRITLHRGFSRSGASSIARTYPGDDTLAKISHLHACIRHHRRQFLQIVELLSAGALSTPFHARILRHAARRGQ